MLDTIKELMKQYETKEKKTIKNYQGDFMSIETNEITLNNDSKIIREVLSKPNLHAGMIIPKTVDGKYLMIIQPRPGSEIGATIEFPAGYIEDGEDGETGTKREMLEETGYNSDSLTLVKHYYQDVACSKCKISVFLAENCKRVAPQKLDETEMITYIEVTYDELMELFDNNMIVDCNSILCIYYLKSIQNRV